MTDFGDIVVSETPPPPQATVEASNDDISESARQLKLDTARIHLFRWAIYAALFGFAMLLVTLICVIKVYLCLLIDQPKEIPNNFWHIPLLLAFMASTILSIILTLTAKFGDKNHKQEDSKDKASITILADHVPIKELLQKLIDKIK